MFLNLVLLDRSLGSLCARSLGEVEGMEMSLWIVQRAHRQVQAG